MCVWVAQCRLCKVTSFIAIRSSTTVCTCFTCSNLVYVRVWMCALVGGCFVSVDNTDSCNTSLSCILVHLLVSPQVGAFPPHVSREAIPPAHQTSSLLQPVCGSWVCVCMYVACVLEVGMCVCIFVHDRYWYSILLPMVSVGSPTVWCVPSPCVHGNQSTLPSAFFCCTASTDDTTRISANTGLCVVWVWICLRTSELL